MALVDTWPLLVRIWKLQRGLLKQAAPCIDELGLSPRDLMLLALIERFPSPGLLARELRLPTPSVSHAMKRLEKHGFVQRQSDPGDLRRFIFALTQSGRRALVKGQECLQAGLRKSLERLEPAEQETLARLLNKVTEEPA